MSKQLHKSWKTRHVGVSHDLRSMQRNDWSRARILVPMARDGSSEATQEGRFEVKYTP